MSKVVAIADGDYGFQFFIEKAELGSDPEDSFSVVGVASTPNIDHDNERMAEPALERMARIINSDSVPLRVEHQKSENAIIGDVYKAWIDERQKMWIKARLHKDNPAAQMLHNALKSGAKLGLSVGGRVKHATTELAEGVGKQIKTFYDVFLDEVSVTPRPSNYDAWLINKHIVEPGADTSAFYNTDIYDRFLFQNPKLDYLAAIEKSIPSQDWRKVEPEINLNKEMENTKTETTQMEETKPTTTPTEESVATKSYVDSRFNEVLGLLKSIKKTMADETDSTGTGRMMTAGTSESVEALDQSIVEDTKEVNPAQVRTVKTGANGGQTSTESETQPALDESNPAEVKETPVTESTLKSMFKELISEIKKTTTSSDSTGSSSKDSSGSSSDSSSGSSDSSSSSSDSSDSSSSSDSTSTGSDSRSSTGSSKNTFESEGSESGGSSSGSSSSYGGEYQLPELQRAMKSKGFNDMDTLIAVVSNMVNDAEDRMAKSGKRVVGMREHIADIVRNDPEIQKSIRGFINTPGSKKSYVSNNGYVFMKDGSRMRLVAEDAFIQKSFDPKAKFTDTYKQNFSGLNDSK